MIYLKWNTDRLQYENLEKMHFAPCPAVDLIWHSHLLNPDRYYVVCVRLD
jgi:hypothetical protein